MNYKQKEWLKVFWDKIAQSSEENDRIALLQNYSMLTVPKEKFSITAERSRFEKIKKSHWKMGKGHQRKCLACKHRADVRHHILQIKNNGTSSKKNICFLCENCHMIIHPHLQDRVESIIGFLGRQ